MQVAAQWFDAASREVSNGDGNGVGTQEGSCLQAASCSAGAHSNGSSGGEAAVCGGPQHMHDHNHNHYHNHAVMDGDGSMEQTHRSFQKDGSPSWKGPLHGFLIWNALARAGADSRMGGQAAECQPLFAVWPHPSAMASACTHHEAHHTGCSSQRGQATQREHNCGPESCQHCQLKVLLIFLSFIFPWHAGAGASQYHGHAQLMATWTPVPAQALLDDQVCVDVWGGMGRCDCITKEEEVKL